MTKKNIIILLNIVTLFICIRWIKKGGAEEATIALISQIASLLMLLSETKISDLSYKRVKGKSKITLKDKDSQYKKARFEDIEDSEIEY